VPLFPDLPLAAVLDVIRGAVMVVFVLSALLVIIIVLLQEGKGGGLAGAFGGAGAETFGVKAGTVNKFTAWLAALFLGLALLHAGLSSEKRGAPKEADTREYDSTVEDPGGGDAPEVPPPGGGNGNGNGDGDGDD
jgi:preprotein translocase subunit SecG